MFNLNCLDQEEEGVEEVIKMMYVGVLVDDRTVEATVAVVLIDMNSLENWQLSLLLQEDMVVQERPYISTLVLAEK